MMKRVWSTDLAEHQGETALVLGWLHRKRELKNLSFLAVRDAKGLAQVVLEDPGLIEAAKALRNESVVRVEGKVFGSGEARGGAEFRDPVITVISEAEGPVPIDLSKKELGAHASTLLDHAALTLRHPAERAKFRLSAITMGAFRRFLAARGFTEIQTPKLVESATESGANVFKLDYFGRPAFLAQSPQLYKQVMVGVFERVFEVGPVFRAEPHATVRHLNEYVSLDVEMGFIEDHRDLMALLTELLRHMLSALEAEGAAELALLGTTMPRAPEAFPSVLFKDAQEMIYRATGEDCRGENDLAPAHEKWLGDWAAREYGSDFLFVEGYPMSKRPFYTRPMPGDPEYSNSFDLLFRGLELVTGGQRLHRHADYLAAMAAKGVDPASLPGYLEAFRYGMPSHGGFAIGLERWLARLLGLENIRETCLFPRDINRLSP